jgi:hypothetical protein
MDGITNLNNISMQKLKNQIDYQITNIYQKSSREVNLHDHRLFEITNLEDYSRISKLEVGREKLDKITNQIDLHRVSQLTHLERMKNYD